MSNMIAGTCFLTVDGKSVQLVGEFTYRPSSQNRETLVGMDTVHGFKGSPAAGMIKGKLRDSGTLSVQQLGDADDVTVVAVLANTKTVIGRNMWRVGEPLEADADNGEISIQWEGVDVSEN